MDRDRDPRAADLEAELAAARTALDAERARADRATEQLVRLERASQRFVPWKMLRLLRADSLADLKLGDQCERRVTVLFCDIRDFTTLSERLTPSESFAFLNSFLAVMEPAISRYGGVVDKYIGDAIMAVFPDQADDAVCAAIALFDALGTLNEQRVAGGLAPLRIGAGLDTGLVVLGTVGAEERMDATVISDTVNLASRLEGCSKAYRAPLLISEHTLGALSSPERFAVRFIDRILVRGKVRPQSVYEVFDVDPPEHRRAKRATRGRLERAIAFYHLKEIDKAVPLLEECCRELPDDAAAALYLERCRQFRASGLHFSTGEAGKTLEWSPAFNVGFGPIDQQHQELLARLNALSEQVRRGESGRMGEILEFVGSYAASHFRLEEGLMRAHEYPFLREHVQEHQRFEATFRELDEEIRSGAHEPLSLVFRIQVFLIDWFITHSTGTDRHLGRHLLSRGVSPELDP